MKIAVSLRDPLFEAADRLADQLGLTRSALFARAVAEFLERHRSDRVTEKLNAVYGTRRSELDPVLDRIQLSSLPREDG